MVVTSLIQQHPLIFSQEILGFQGYSPEDMFSVFADGANNFLDYGIVEGSLLVVDQKIPFAEGKLCVFETGRELNGQKHLKVSKISLDGLPYIGQIVMSVNLYH